MRFQSNWDEEQLAPSTAVVKVFYARFDLTGVSRTPQPIMLMDQIKTCM